MSKALFGAGCFWGPEKKFSEIKGVIETQVGYSQGLTDKTSYEEVCKGNTNHAEVVFLKFDENLFFPWYQFLMVLRPFLRRTNFEWYKCILY